MEESAGSRGELRSKKRKKLKVRTEAIAESRSRIPPLVGYFPSGYDPEGEGEQPDIKVLRNQKHPGRLELVVSPRNSKVQFVGRSYAGEAAVPQLCTYALGVLDKETRSLKIVPIAANKIFRMEPRVMEKASTDMVAGEVTVEDGSVRKMQDLTSLYGTKKDRVKDNKWKLLLSQQKTDSAVEGNADGQMKDDGVKELQAPGDDVANAPRNIPPHDTSAVAPEKAYLIDEIILKGERRHLLDILEMVESGQEFVSSTKFWQENGYPSFVYNRIQKLREIKDDEKKKNLACILSFITHLVNFMGMAVKERKSLLLFHHSVANIPKTIYQRLLSTFADPESQLLSTEKRELLIGYILVLTLFADEFRTDSLDVSKDLKMPSQDLRPYFLQLGCKPCQDIKFRASSWTLPVPLQFQELKKRRRRQ